MNFRNIIVPEALKTLHMAEPSVCEALDAMGQMIVDAGWSLDSMVSQLDIQLRNAIMGMQVLLGHAPHV